MLARKWSKTTRMSLLHSASSLVFSRSTSWVRIARPPESCWKSSMLLSRISKYNSNNAFSMVLTSFTRLFKRLIFDFMSAVMSSWCAFKCTISRSLRWSLLCTLSRSCSARSTFSFISSISLYSLSISPRVASTIRNILSLVIGPVKGNGNLTYLSRSANFPAAHVSWSGSSARH